MSADLQKYTAQRDCVYKDEGYSVRDNGAVMRHARVGKRLRPKDNQWTFGNPNNRTGYMDIVSVRAHRIVATAFHGDPPTQQHVVDHIDTNRRNNRPENLRWVTRLENILLNPITAKRIAYLYGSIEEFIANPAKPIKENLEPNVAWMRTVSAEEAKACYQRLLALSKFDRSSTGGSLGEWLFTRNARIKQSAVIEYQQPELIEAKTSGAVQRDWKIPAYFPYCPQGSETKSLSVYFAKLDTGSVFSSNQYGVSIVLETAMALDKEKFWVMCAFAEKTIKQWSLAQVTFEGGLFVHTNLGSFFERQGAEKELCLAQGLEWTGGDTFDDYC